MLILAVGAGDYIYNDEIVGLPMVDHTIASLSINDPTADITVSDTNICINDIIPEVHQPTQKC